MSGGGQEEEDVAIGKMGFEGSQPLMNQEAKHVLEEAIKSRKLDNPGWQPSKIVQDALDYVNHLPSAKNRMVIDNIRGKMVDARLTGTEVALVGNLLPENVEECRAMVASTDNEERLPDYELQQLLDELIRMQNLPGA